MPDAPPNQPPPRNWRATLRRLGPAGLLAAVSVTLPALGSLLVVATIHRSAPWLKSQGWLGAVLYVLAFWPLGGFAIVPTWSFSALAGWAWGAWLGTPLALAAFTGAAAVAHLFGAAVCGDRVTLEIESRARWKAVHRALVGRGFWRTLGIVTLLRIPPSSPFSLTNYLLASIRVPLGPYLLGTLMGLAPRTAAVVVTFAGLQQFNPARPADSAGIAVSVVATLAVVAVLIVIARRALRNLGDNAGG